MIHFYWVSIISHQLFASFCGDTSSWGFKSCWMRPSRPHLFFLYVGGWICGGGIVQNLTFVPCKFSWSPYSSHHGSLSMFWDPDLHPLFGIFPQCMLIVHSIHNKVYRVHIFTQALMQTFTWAVLSPRKVTSIKEHLWWPSCYNPLKESCIQYTLATSNN